MPSASPLADETLAGRHEIVLVDPSVPDYRRLVDAIVSRGSANCLIEVALIGPDGEGFNAVDLAAQGWGGLDAIHVISHGEPGTILIGGARLTSENLSAFHEMLQRWAIDLRTGGDLLFYGCNVAGSPEGRVLLQSIRELTGADVAASTDLTGSSRLGGDWELEYADGMIEAGSLSAPSSWTGLLNPSDGLLLATHSDVNSSRAPGLNSWSTGTVVHFGDPNLALEPGGTSGTFSALANLDAFGDGDVKITGLHYVRRPVAMGTGSATISLLPGDLVLASEDNETLTSLNSLTVKKDDVFVFRPATPGNYTSGTFLMLLDKFKNVSGGGEVSSLAVVEDDTFVGNTLLLAGTLLFTPKGGSGANDIRMFVPTGVGQGATDGIVYLLIEGNHLNYSGKIHGLELIDETTTIGGRTLVTGTLLVSLASDDSSVGTNRIPVMRQDVFALTVTRTSVGGSTAVASASLLFRGSDVGLAGSALHGIALVQTPASGMANSVPVPAADQYSTTEDGVLSVPAATGVLANDRDDDGDPLSAELTTPPLHGTVALNADGSFVYTPVADYAGPDQFTYTAIDGRGGRATTTVGITVSAVNDTPTLNPIAGLTVAEDSGPQVVPLTGITAGGPESQGVFITASSSDPTVVAHPEVIYSSPEANGSLMVQPVANASGSATITVVVRDTGFDGVFGTADDEVTTQQFVVTVAPANDPPVSLPDGYTRFFSFPFGVSAANGVLANDIDVEGGPLTAILVSDAAYGNVSLNPDGSFNYSPFTFFQWYTDSFTYQAVDAAGSRSPVTTVTINFGSGNNPPAAAEDAYSTPENTLLVGTSVLATDVDGDGDALTAVLAAGPAHGALQFDPDGTFTYTPTAGYSGPDSFTYRAFDGQAYSAIANVSLSIIAVNDAPLASDDLVTLAEEGSVVVPVLANDTDPDGDTMTVVSMSIPDHGTVTTDGTMITYTADPDYNGPDSFQYTLSDGNGGLAAATVEVTVTPESDLPAADDTGVVAGEDIPAAGTLLGSDVDGDTLSYWIVDAPAHGTLTGFDPATGEYTYTPHPDYHGPDLFMFRVNDGTNDSNVATVRLTVVPVNDAPTATGDDFVIGEGLVLTTLLPGVMANDSDRDGDSLAALLTRDARHGSVQFRSDGTFTYTPNPGFSGQDSFRYRVTDGSLSSQAVLVRIEIEPEAEPPPADPDDDVDVSPLPDPTPPAIDPKDGDVEESDEDSAENPVLIPPGSNPSNATGTGIFRPAGPDEGAVAANGPPEKVRPPIQREIPQAASLPPLPGIPLPPAVRDVSQAGTAVLVPPLIAVAPALPPILPAAAEDTLLRGLSELDSQVQATASEEVVIEVAAASGLVISAGYMLLNPRLALWLFGALAARKAIWKPFDPLDVVYAWEHAEENLPGKDGEEKSLKSMFGA